MSPTILIALVDRNLRDVLSQFFTLQGYTVEIGYSGVDWVEKLERETAETVVVDAHMFLDGSAHVLAHGCEGGSIARVPLVVLNAETIPPAKRKLARWPIVIQLTSPVLLASVEAAVLFARLAASDGERVASNVDWGRATCAFGERV